MTNALVRRVDYPRTLREWGRRVEANLTPEMLAEDFPGIMNPAEFEAFKRKWHYLVAYAGVGFAKGYTTCHMWTFIRQVRHHSSIVPRGLTNNMVFCRMTPLIRNATRCAFILRTFCHA